MYINTYINYSDNNKLNKNIQLVESNVSVELKENTDLINPVLKLSMRYTGSPASPAYFNYCYISEFGRYYFVKNRTYSQQHLEVSLQVDPLYTWADYIANLEVIANRSSSRFDLYLPDNDVPVRADANVKCIPFYDGFTAEGNEEFILAVSGGYQPEPEPEPEPEENGGNS